MRHDLAMCKLQSLKTRIFSFWESCSSMSARLAPSLPHQWEFWHFFKKCLIPVIICKDIFVFLFINHQSLLLAVVGLCYLAGQRASETCVHLLCAMQGLPLLYAFPQRLPDILLPFGRVGTLCSKEEDVEEEEVEEELQGGASNQTSGFPS